MAGEKGGEPTIDPRAHENRYDFRRTVPEDLFRRFEGLLVEKVTPRQMAPSRTRFVAAVSEEDQVIQKRIIAEPLNNDRVEVDKLERELINILIRDLARPAVKDVSEFRAMYPYEKSYQPLTMIPDEIDSLKQDLAKNLQGHKPDRLVQLTNELDGFKGWFEGTTAELKSACAVLPSNFDAYRMMGAVKAAPRYDISATENYLLWSSLKTSESELGKEIINKQNSAVKILRGISAAHRYKDRNMGKLAENDYPITDEQARFVKEVFGAEKKVETITDIMSGREAIRQARDHFSYARNRGGSIGFVSGETREITNALLDGWRKNPSLLRGKAVFVDGVQWIFQQSDLANALPDLASKVGSGDRLFIGETLDVDVTSIGRFERRVSNENSVARLDKIPITIDNIFTMPQEAAALEQVKKKIAVMMNLDIWKRLKTPGVSVDAVIAEFNRGMTEYKWNALDSHIIEMSRITLLHLMEGASLGEGYDIDWKKPSETINKNIGLNKRTIAGGSTSACTDIATTFDWLKQEASNKFKGWTKGFWPITNKVARQILEHRRGWFPPDIEFMGVHLHFDVPASFNLAFLESASAKIGSGEYKGKRPMDLIKGQDMDMSDIPWKGLKEESIYRWYITLSQAVIIITAVTKAWDRDVTEAFGGDPAHFNLAQLLENNKRENLGNRDTDTDDIDGSEKIMPVALALQTAFAENGLPTSPSPGNFNSGKMRDDSRNVEVQFEQLAPKGNIESSVNMIHTYRNLVDSLITVGVRMRSYVASRKLKIRPPFVPDEEVRDLLDKLH